MTRDYSFEDTQGRHPDEAKVNFIRDGIDTDDGTLCGVCHEPIADGCVCQDAYRSEHDSGDMER